MDDLGATLRRRYERGTTITALAARHGLTYYKTRRMLIQAGATLRVPGTETPSAPPGLVEDYLNGSTINEVAAAHDLSFGIARRMLLAEGVTLRPPGTRA